MTVADLQKKKKGGRLVLEFSPVAIVDIGSNSIRLLVYDGLRRAPLPLFNEKLICGLGRGVAVTGSLNEDAVERALRELRRFRALGRQIGISKLYAVATAAVRDADNGPDFVKRAEEALGGKISVLSGKKEARLTAMGLLAGVPGAEGVVGDLGGGSLELVRVEGGEIRDGTTLALGPLHLMDVTSGSLDMARDIIDEALANVDLLDGLEPLSFYAVGGAWRNLARIHMAQNQYPLSVIHQYEMGRDAARSIANLVSGLSPETLREIRVVAKERSETMPYGALVLDRLLARARPNNVVISAFGLREGLLHSKLPKKVRARDPLLSSCSDFAQLRARSPKHARELCAWTDQLFGPGRLEETAQQRRLRHAACLVSDISWRAHPDYRAERSFSIISQGAFVGASHPERVFLALAAFYRYEGVWSDKAPAQISDLIDEDASFRVRVIASALRLAYLLSGAMPGLLPKIGLEYDERKKLKLLVPKDVADLAGERIEKRVAELAMLTGRKPEIEIGNGRERASSQKQ